MKSNRREREAQKINDTMAPVREELGALQKAQDGCGQSGKRSKVMSVMM